MIRMGMAKIAAVPEKTAMVGDRLYTDIQMAYNAGITSVLVLSGETKIADLEEVERRPDYVFASVRELHEALKESGLGSPSPSSAGDQAGRTLT
jgi:NagD protein